MKKIVSLLLLASVLSAVAAPKGPPPIISVGADGQLVYGLDARSNRVPDFSSCGYAGGNQEIPNVPVRVVVTPTAGDETELIQRALDQVASLSPDTNGLRSAVLLLKGRHEILGGLVITNSGVVLRGQGVGEDGTVLVGTGLDRRTLIRVFGKKDFTISTNANWEIADDYVPVGATSFHLAEVGGLKAGDAIRVIRPSTQVWIDQLGANEFGGGEGGGWKPGSRDIAWNRKVKFVEGNLVTVDAPITTAIEKELGGGRVEKFSSPGLITNVGIENLALESTFDAANAKDENHSWFGITMENTADAWVRQVAFKNFAGSAVALYETVQRVTVQDCLSLAPVSEIGGYRRHTFFTMGQQTLFLRCYAEHGRHDFSVGHCGAGPNAFVQCEAREALDGSGPIESWASGVLYDNVTIDGNALTLGYLAGNNAAIGWAAANSVLWNCSASVIRCWNPPGAQNWSFGSWGSFEGDGVWRSSNNFMSPDSLFAAQLGARLGKEFSARLQLMARPHEESSNPSVEKAQELAAASHEAAPLLRDYISAASKRNPIPDSSGSAKRIEDIAEIHHSSVVTRHPLVITNGWLTIDGKLVIGGTADVTWWRGSIRPDEADDFGLAVTRFVPGRMGSGFTDDLNELADSLVVNGRIALDHNYGLWYDRRRDDHERIRRMNGDVLPPCFEMPFTRTGEGLAWLGLSKYDLTKFNPWYWSRLQQFADIADARGLVLFHENYFQHNIIEAGAHWVDSPWRSANNINGTEFPEPPPFAGDKRVFQAELFYDETNPVRRKLHEGYIRQCLDNFTNNANVIQFTSAEFTGPLHFMQFWLDTISVWERDQIKNSKSKIQNPLVALSATKDVQDAILADAQRNALVDVIDFRYWWRTDKGEFAPPGGKNLAPRQFERQWRGGRPNDENLASMAAEYRGKFPGKALLCDFDSAGWAWVCAGGSLPRLPKTTDRNFLAAIPLMQAWPEVSGKNYWALREAGKQMLIFHGGDLELNLAGESGAFRLHFVDKKSGTITDGETVQAGGKIKLPGANVVWLTKE